MLSENNFKETWNTCNFKQFSNQPLINLYVIYRIWDFLEIVILAAHGIFFSTEVPTGIYVTVMQVYILLQSVQDLNLFKEETLGTRKKEKLHWLAI